MSYRKRKERPARRTLFVALLCAGGLVSATAAAQVARSGGTAPAGAEAARLAQQLQQVTSERAQLQAEVARLRQELEAAKRAPAAPAGADTQALRRQAQAAAAEAGRLRASSTEAEEKYLRTQAKLDELVAKYRETAAAMSGIEQERNALQTTNRRQGRDLGTCVANNTALVAMNEELLQRIETTGFWDRAAASEPFTRLKRTQLENVAAENRARAAELQVAAPGEGARP